MVCYGVEDDPASFNELYRRYQSKVFGYLILKCPPKEFSEEIHQLVFMKLHQARTQYDPKYPFAPWLFTIVRSTMIDEIRRRAKHGVVASVDSSVLEAVAAAEVKQEEPAVELDSVLDAEQKKLLDLRYQKEWSFAEIAKEFGVSEAGARKKISRILNLIRSKI